MPAPACSYILALRNTLRMAQRDLFASLPVRRKMVSPADTHRALADIMNLALVFPEVSTVTVTVTARLYSTCV